MLDCFHSALVFIPFSSGDCKSPLVKRQEVGIFSSIHLAHYLSRIAIHSLQFMRLLHLFPASGQIYLPPGYLHAVYTLEGGILVDSISQIKRSETQIENLKIFDWDRGNRHERKRTHSDPAHALHFHDLIFYLPHIVHVQITLCFIYLIGKTAIGNLTTLRQA
ncbi:hypothetical protein K469DRAFT_206242 [Zopfia rhizophila CBS 207.26]|uniref:Uncharacterized protein n=1 Tax=Zopfia rhizophila CBS 207.26 TaxID=1314779 RepID=A0A6A6DZH3_9PEZI|nr:hypothetical protein K469DRAFT_206242 [Zopfia rhizophila CBS 207.26]